MRYKGIGHPADYQMRILFEKTHNGHRSDIYRDFRPGELFEGRMPEEAVASTRVVVNLFDGGPKSKVSMRIGSGAYEPMRRVLRPDPYIVESFVRNRETIKSWVQPIPSSHLFEAPLPDGLQPGTWTVSVKAVDEFGRTHHAHRVLEISGSSASVY